jgi:hypothetical protein
LAISQTLDGLRRPVPDTKPHPTRPTLIFVIFCLLPFVAVRPGRADVDPAQRHGLLSHEGAANALKETLDCDPVHTELLQAW